MNSMKTLVVMGLLAAAGYYTYMYMGQKPESSSADPQAFPSPPTVQIPGLNSPSPQLAGATSSGPSNAPRHCSAPAVRRRCPPIHLRFSAPADRQPAVLLPVIPSRQAAASRC